MATLLSSCLPPHDRYPFCDGSLPEERRLDDLISRLTLEELVGQLFMDAKLAFGNTSLGENSSRGDLSSTGASRLGIAQFNYMGQGSIFRGASNGCNLGCCTGGKVPCVIDTPFATVFPQGTGIAASFDPALVFAAGVAISDESRAMQTVSNRTVEYRTGASSVINIARDPRWGRVAETYGECPRLTGRIAVAFNKGLLGFSSYNDASSPPPRVYKTLPVIRHLGAYAGPEVGRFAFDAMVTETDLNLTYLPAWKALVEAKAIAGAMSAISAVNGMPGIAHTSLLTSKLRTEWGFDGFVLSDCDTFPALITQWQWASSPEQASAVALAAGNDANCGPGFAALRNASRLGMTSRVRIAAAARRVLRLRLRVGDLQPPSTDPWRARTNLSVVGCHTHAVLVDELVAAGTVLLHHTPGTLPLDASHGLRTIALVGPSADDPAIQAHTYHGTPERWITVKDAIVELLAEAGREHLEAPGSERADVDDQSAQSTAGFASKGTAPRAQAPRARVLYSKGCSIEGKNTSGFSEAMNVAQRADAIVYVGGLHSQLEEEDTDRMDSPQRPNGLGLPGIQLQLLAKLRAIATARHVPLVVLLVSGGPLAVPTLAPPHAHSPDALLWTTYYGQSARALARILLGSAYPSGRLPFTVPYNASSSLPPIEDYRMNAYPGRTYRYLDSVAVPPLYPFGHGLTLGPAWSVSAFATSVPSLSLSALLAAGTHPCTEVAGVALSVHLTLVRAADLSEASLVADGTPPGAPPPRALPNASISLLLFAALGSTMGIRSPFPRTQLLTFTKPSLAPGTSRRLELSVCARDLLQEGLGLHRQPLPNALRLWVGDAGGPQMVGAEAVVPIDDGELLVDMVERVPVQPLGSV